MFIKLRSLVHPSRSEVGVARGERGRVSAAPFYWWSGITGIFLLGCVPIAFREPNSLFAKTVAHWTFNEGSLGYDVPVVENAVPDISGNGNHLRAWSTGTSPTYLNDLPFHRVPLTGEANHLALNFTPNRDLYTDSKEINGYVFTEWTVEASFKLHATNRWQVLVGRDGNPVSGPPPFSLKLRADNQNLEMGVVDGRGTWRTVFSQEPLQAGLWYTVAATATSTVASLWLKGPDDEDYVLQGTAELNGAWFDTNGTRNAWTVGRGMWNGRITDWCDAVIDQVRISDVALRPEHWLAARKMGTNPSELAIQGLLVEKMRENGKRDQLALEAWSPGEQQTISVEGSPDLAAWNDVSFETEIVAEKDGRERLRLVSDVAAGDHERFFLRGRVNPPDGSVEPRNPILPGADPDVLLVGETAWVYPTYRSGDGRFFAFSSKDLVSWQIHGPLLDFDDIPWIPAGKQAWAPGIAQRDGKFYFYYSVGPKPSYIGVAVADSPAGPFIDSGAPLLFDDGDPGFEAIDAMVFTDPRSGKSYFYAGGSAGATLRVFGLNDDMVSFAREITVDTPSNFTEGSFMHYRDGIYYLSYSRGYWRDASYSVHYSTSATPVGPWVYRGKLLSSDERHKGPGHHSILHNPRADEWYIIYHRWNDRTGTGPFVGSRTVAIELLEYDDHGLLRPVTMTDTGVGPVKLK